MTETSRQAYWPAEAVTNVPHGHSIHREPAGYRRLVWLIFGHYYYVEMLYYVTFKQERVCTSHSSFKRNYFCIDMLPRNSDCLMTQVCTWVRQTSELLHSPSFESFLPQELPWDCTAQDRRALRKKAPWVRSFAQAALLWFSSLCFALSKW